MPEEQEKLIAAAVEVLVANGWRWEGPALRPQWDANKVHESAPFVVSDT